MGEGCHGTKLASLACTPIRDHAAAYLSPNPSLKGRGILLP